MRLGILGAGAVGSSVAALASSYDHTVTAIADSRSSAIDSDGIDVEAVLERKEAEGVVGEEDSEAAIEAEYDCLVEVTPIETGDAETAFEHVRAAFAKDRHVVLGNKGPIAQRYGEVRDLATESAGELHFESTIDGLVPILSTISDVGPDRVRRVRGVFNGLANFVLSRMTAEGLGYEHVLAEAQDLGVAEVDPTFDVEGTDSALTCCILANVLAGGAKEYTIDDVNIKGITEVRGSAIDLAKEEGMTVRLLGEVEGDHLRVAPRTIPTNSPLAVAGARTVVELDVRGTGPAYISSSAASPDEFAASILTDVNRIGG